MPQTSSIMMSVSELHENGQNPVIPNRNTHDFAKVQHPKDTPLWLRTNANDARPGTRRGSLEPMGEFNERVDSRLIKGRRKSFDTSMRTPRPSSASRRRTAPDLDLVGATPSEVSIRNRTNVADTSVIDSKNQTSCSSNKAVTSHGYPNSSSIYHKQHSQAPMPPRSMPIDCDDGLPGSIQQCSSNVAKQNCQPLRPKSAHHRYRRPVLETRDIDDVDVETLTLNDEINNMDRPTSPNMIDRSVTRLARPLTPPARPTITLEVTGSSEEDWSSDDSTNTLREGSHSVLRVKRKHLRRRFDVQQDFVECEEIPNRHNNVHRTHSDGSRNIPSNFRVEKRSEVAERVAERYRRRAQSDVSSLENVKHLFTNNDIVLNSKHKIVSKNSKPRTLRPILQRSRETMMLGDGAQDSKRNSPENAQPQRRTLEPMNHLIIPKNYEADVYPSPPSSADKTSDQEFFGKDNDLSPRPLRPINSQNDLERDVAVKRSPFLSRSCPDAAVSS